MTFEQLEYFIAAVDQDTFLNAAFSLHITQSALSKQIMKLEKEIGVQLFDRNRRSASLTEAGQIFYQEALSLQQHYKQTIGKMQQYKSTLQNNLRIGTLPILTQYHLTSRFKAFAEQHSDIHIVIDEVEEESLMEGLKNDTYALIIAREHMINSNKYKSFLLAEDEMVVVLPLDHRLFRNTENDLAKKTSLSLSELDDERFILMNPYTAIYQLCIDAFKKAGISGNIVRTARVESIISAVSVHEGISLLAKRNFEVFQHPNITALQLNPPIRLPVVAVIKKSHTASPLVGKLISALTDH